MKETMKEIYAAKKKLEEDIKKLLSNFTDEEGLIIESIYMRYRKIEEIGSENSLVSIPSTYIVETIIRL